MSGKKKALLGIDTSNYRTSLSLVDEEGKLLADERAWLKVESGERGLQQSTAFFQHVNCLPELFARIPLDGVRLVGVAASQAPRPVEGSYMPVFRAGVSWGRSLAHAWGVPFFGTTHQEGHIEAGWVTADRKLASDRFLAFHLSGGTTELLDVRRQPGGYEILKLGGTRDLNAGQMVDRIGVAMGFSFPAGPELEVAAVGEESSTLTIPSSVSGLECSFSGPLSALERAWQRGEGTRGEIAQAALACIANTLEKMVLNAFDSGFPKSLLIVGGVAANRWLIARLKYRLEHRAVGGNLSFADPRFSGDNALGVACLGLKKRMLI
ncbi:N6-L-threonylcarbamoyladenine synthase [Kroppenstedtia sanguinis]|uniref:N(6)-L-threonylcarbamoyladenine synthase n=1 Tax=Kroppenstedtia sanguinis TaxID=1380684 RepID=A0ABW4CEQ7_9BACL